MVSDTVVSVNIDVGTSIAQVQYLVSTLWAYGTTLVAVAAAIAAVFAKKEGAIGTIQEIINILALNVGYAKNASAKSSSDASTPPNA